MGTWVRRLTPRERQKADEDHADDAAVEHHLQRAERVGGELDAHAHAGEEQRGGDHPRGLHDV
jgi:hypothetical protein